MGSVGKNIDIKSYAESHGDIWITQNMMKSWTPSEMKTMVDRVNEVYKEFGLDPSKKDEHLVYSLYSDPNMLSDMFGKASFASNGTLSVNPNSNHKDVLDTIYHEMGHAVEIMMKSKLFPSLGDNADNMARRIVHEANSHRLQHYPNSTDYVSNYGLTNARELVAEGVRDYMMNRENATPMAKSIVHRMKRLIDTRIRGQK